jgi:uncharacterized protein (TIGR01244 family)
MYLKVALIVVPAIVGFAVSAHAQGQVTKETVPGVVNFTRVETTVACGGTIKPEAVAEIKQKGFKSIIDLQLPDEKGADVPGEAAAAKAAGMNFVHIPFSPAAADTTPVDTFLKAVSAPANQPAFIHCAGGNRAAGLWMVKRVLVDKWDVARAQTEAEALGLSSAPMKKYALDYIQAHQR